jgi:choline dehydrogenase-like flavoprotein
MKDSIYDVAIVGGGATGGWTAKLLTEGGLTVALIEAGDKTTSSDFSHGDRDKITAFRPASAALLETHPIQSQCYACREPHSKWFVDDVSNPYTQVSPYSWIRMRVLGGRLLSWEGQSYRMSDLDFKAADLDGYGDNWPLSYQDLKPHYDKAESYLQVTGTQERLPYLPDGDFVVPKGTNISCRILRIPLRDGFDRTVTPARLAQMTGSWEGVDSVLSVNDGSSRGFASPWRALVDAERTGRLTLFPNTVATTITTHRGLADGVVCVNTESGKSIDLPAKRVVLCSSTLESTRLLLASDLSNSSGLLGHYLMDHIFGGGASGFVEVPRSEFLNGGTQRHRAYIPRFRNLPGNRGDVPFLRGYGFQGKCLLALPTDLKSLWKLGRSNTVRVRVTLTAFGECLARYDNCAKLNMKQDQWGMPSLSINAIWSANEISLIDDAKEQAALMLEAAGVKHVMKSKDVSTPGLSIHEIGTARMGVDPSSSVLDPFCQSHDVKNLYVFDGSCWVSSGNQNPTLTMLALAGRACDKLLRVAG